MRIEFGAYYAVGNACFGLADDLHSAFTTETATLNTCDGMAGVDEEGISWAADYDTRVSELLTLVADLGEAVQKLGRVTVQCGYENYLADYYSIADPAGPPSAMPAMPTAERRSYGAPCKAGANSGGGLRDSVDDVIGLANKVGIAVPDGDTDQLQVAAEAWNRLQNNYTENFVAVLSTAATVMDGCDAADAVVIAEKLRGLQTAVDDVLAACGELSAMCTEFKDALWALRRQMLWSILEELGWKIAERAVLMAASSFLTFGASVVIGGVAIADTVLEYARKIADKVRDWRRLRAQAKAARKQRDLGNSKQKVNDAQNLDDGQGPSSMPSVSGIDWAKITDILQQAKKNKGNFGLGEGTMEEAEAAGKAWVGPNAKLASDGKTWVSEDGLRQYRPPSYKPNLGLTQANFEWRTLPSTTKEWQGNGHLYITDAP